MILRLVTLIGLILSLTACGPDVLYEKSEDLGPTGWSYADSVSFDFSVPDTSERYDLVLSISHGDAFPYQNFYTHLTTHLPDGSTLNQPLSIQLSDKYGGWFGNCGGGSCTLDIGIQQGARFTQTGSHRVVVSQFSREDPLSEITGVGFRVVRVPKQD